MVKIQEIAKPRSEKEVTQAEQRKKLRMLKRRDDEPLHDWVKRISEAYGLNEEQTRMVHDVAKEAYIIGSNAMYDTLKMDI